MSPRPRIVSPTEEVVAQVNELGLKEVAKQYSIDQSNLWRWLKNQGYRRKVQYVKVASPQQN